MGYVNDFVGYLPDEADFHRKGYAADLVPDICGNFPFVPNIGEIVVKDCIEVLNKLEDDK